MPGLARKEIIEQQANLRATTSVSPTVHGLSEAFTFIDLFAGIGGFHLAASSLGGDCVFASEFDDKARHVYQDNFLKESAELFGKGRFAGDITLVKERDIPSFDFLFAGFPCQPFSKGGFRRGFEDTRGTLFFDVARIINYHKPNYILLENVHNFVSHDSGRTYRTVCNKLRQFGYAINRQPLILSPDDFGISAIRKRLFIPAIQKRIVGADYLDLTFDHKKQAPRKLTIYSVTDKRRVNKKYYISDYEKQVLEVWNHFYQGIDIKVIGFPIWADYFKKAKVDNPDLPHWKKVFIEKNRELYKRNKKFIVSWLNKYENLNWMRATHKKLEWQAGTDIKNIYEGLIQFRPSGVRVKRPDRFSTLVAMVQHQIVGKYCRRLTPDETKRLQSFPEHFKLHENDSTALKQLGNSVNVAVVKEIISKMLKYG